MNLKLSYLIIILLSLLAYKFTDLWSIKTYENARAEIQAGFLEGKMPPPLTYSVLTPGIAHVLQKIFKPVAGTQARAFLYSYELINLAAFVLIFIFFYIFLRIFFTELTSMTGLFLFLAVIPLAVSVVWPESGIVNFLFFTIGLILMFRLRDEFIPVIIGLGMLNDTGIIFLLVFYIIYLFTYKKLTTKKSFLVIILSVLSGAAVYIALRFKIGSPSDDNLFRISENIENISLITQLWLTEVFMFVLLSIKAFRSSIKFFRLSFIALFGFILLFFLFENMNDFVKFLPAYLMLIPMTLQVLTDTPVIREKETS